MRIFNGIDEIEAAVGEHLGHTEWLQVTQERVDLFAEATGDHQWIHVDPERAAEGPFGTTIAHGYLTVSLLPMFSAQLMRVDGVKMAINYGVNKIRFPQPVRVGSRLRADGQITGFERKASGTQVIVTHTIEIEGSDKPACVAETVRVLVA